MTGTKYITGFYYLNNEEELTYTLNNVSSYSGIDAYFIGFVDKPSFYNACEVNYSSEYVELSKVTHGDKVPFTWGSYHRSSALSRGEGYAFHEESDNSLAGMGNHAYSLPNKMNIGNFNTQAPVFNILGIINASYPEGSDPNLIYCSVIQQHQFGGGDDTNAVLNALKQGTSVTLNFYLHYGNLFDEWIPITFNTSDLQNGYIEVNGDLQAEGFKYFGYIFLWSMWCQPSRDTYDAWETPVSMGEYSNFIPIIKDSGYIIGMDCPPILAPLRITINKANPDSVTLTNYIPLPTNPDIVLGNYDNVTIVKSEMNNLFHYWDWIEINGNCICVNASNGDAYNSKIDVYPYITFNDVDNFIKMFPRFKGRGSPIYTDEYEPTEEYSDDPEELAPWQSDITENEYDGEIPTPIPEEDTGIVESIPPFEGELPDNNENRIIYAPSQFITQYILTPTQISQLGTNLWGSTDTLKNIYLNTESALITGTFNISAILDLIISLRVFPITISDHAAVSAVSNFYIGTGASSVMSGTFSTLDTTSFVVQCGSLTIQSSNNFGDFRDYYNTSISVYLPYCGVVELNPADVWGRSVRCVYYVDVQSGNCTACLYVTLPNMGEMLVGSKSGQIGFLLPITATNAGQLTAQFLSDAQSVLQAVGNIAVEGSNIAAGNFSAKDFRKASGIAGDILGDISNFMSRSGIGIPAIAGGSGLSSMYTVSAPYVIIRRMQYAIPENYKDSVGRRSSSYVTIGRCNGFNQFVNPDLSSIEATEEELNELKRLLESGIYV